MKVTCIWVKSNLLPRKQQKVPVEHVLDTYAKFHMKYKTVSEFCSGNEFYTYLINKSSLFVGNARKYFFHKYQFNKCLIHMQRFIIKYFTVSELCSETKHDGQTYDYHSNVSPRGKITYIHSILDIQPREVTDKQIPSPGGDGRGKWVYRLCQSRRRPKFYSYTNC